MLLKLRGSLIWIYIISKSTRSKSKRETKISRRRKNTKIKQISKFHQLIQNKLKEKIRVATWCQHWRETSIKWGSWVRYAFNHGENLKASGCNWWIMPLDSDALNLLQTLQNRPLGILWLYRQNWSRKEKKIVEIELDYQWRCQGSER